MIKLISVLLLMIQHHIPTISIEHTQINQKINEETKVEILQSVQIILEQYQSQGSFFNDEKEAFDVEKYKNFVSLFSGNATVVDDITWSLEKMSYADYMQIVLDNLKDSGVDFKVEEIEVRKIDIDDTGFYVVDLKMVKHLFTGINESGKPVKLKEGRRVKLEMRIDFPDYLISDARIQYVHKVPPLTLGRKVKSIFINSWPRKAKAHD